MRSSWKRMGLATGLLAVLSSGFWTLAGALPEDVFPCKKVRNRACGQPKCGERPYPGVGACREGLDGPQQPLTIECCCCTPGFQDRYFIGG